MKDNIFKHIQEIGRGSYATVFKSKMLIDYPPLKINDIIAVKQIATYNITDKEQLNHIEKEINLMKTLDHENILKLYYDERNTMYYSLVMEYCEGDLFHYMKSMQKGIEEHILKDFLVQITNGLQCLNDKGIVHRDLKPHNILTKINGEKITLKIADFGLARIIQENDMANTMCGSPIYMAPEVLLHGPYTSAVDMWSLGVIIYEILVQKTPFSAAKTQGDLINEIKKLGSTPVSLPPDVDVSPLLRDLVPKLLTVDPSKRMTLKQLVEHPFLRKKESLPAPSIHTIPLRTGQRFSFSFFEGKRSNDDLLTEAIESSKIIETLFSQCQNASDTLLFDVITLICEFLVDFLREYIDNGGSNSELRMSAIEMIKDFQSEGEDLATAELEPYNVSAIEFLFEQGIQNAIEAAEAEKEGTNQFAQVKYKRSLCLLSPIAFIIECNEMVQNVRSLYSQIALRLINLGNL